MLQKILATLMLLGAIAGCNTMQGFGEDVERGGERIWRASSRIPGSCRSAPRFPNCRAASFTVDAADAEFSTAGR